MKKLLLFVALLPAAAFGYNFNYKIVNNEAIVTKSPEATGVVEIPAKIEVKGVKYPVTAIADSAFYDCWNMTGVKMPNTIKSIGMMAFSRTNIQEPVYTKEIFAFLPESFEGEYKMPKSITTIAGGAMMGCGGLTSIKLPKKLTRIGNLAFWGTSVNHPVYSPTEFVYMPTEYKGSYAIPEGIERIAENAFLECDQLEEVIMPSSMKKIEKKAFMNCRKLITVVLPPELDEIGDTAFYACQWLSKIDFSTCKIEKIGTAAFFNCVALQKIILVEGLTTIGDYAFDHCYDINEVKLPNSLKEVGISVFDHDKKIMSPIYTDKMFIKMMPETATGVYEIPDGIEIIAPRAFRFCQRLTEVKIPGSVKEIGEKAFEFTRIKQEAR